MAYSQPPSSPPKEHIDGHNEEPKECFILEQVQILEHILRCNTSVTFEHLNRLDASEIRLLDLRSGQGEEELHLDLHTYSLEDLPSYIALSYTWGNPEDTVPVSCNNKVLNVTRNLKEALWQLREDRKSLIRKGLPDANIAQHIWLWIDAICINQVDDKEKRSQVARMTEIYQRACKVIVWLGPADNDTNSVMNYLNISGAMAEECGMVTGPEPFRSIWQDMLSAPPAKQQLKLPYVLLDDEDEILMVSRESLQDLLLFIGGFHDPDIQLPITSLKGFFTRPWWGRVWVLQEVTLSDSVEFVCGSRTITRNRCAAAINAYCAQWQVLTWRHISEPKSLTKYQLEIIKNLFHHRPMVMLSSRRVYRDSRFPLAALLRATCVGSMNPASHGPHHLESTDPRDKIFALLGIASDQKELEDLGVTPDYTRSFEQIYTMTMAALLQEGYISLLSMCQTPRSRYLPSWVPDWSQSITDMLQDLEMDHVTLDPIFTASGAGSAHPEVVIITENGVIQGITVIGQLYDEIYRAGDFPDRVSSRKVPLSETFSWPTMWLLETTRLTYCRRTYRDFSSRLHAAARTSIGGVGWDRNGQLEKVGDSRFDDAVILLHRGSTSIRNKRMQSEAQRFLSRGDMKKLCKQRATDQCKLYAEITGKSLGRLPFVTKKGNLILSSEHVKQGDVIALIKGMQVPLILRKTSGEQFQVISEAYVDGIMDGEKAEVSQFGPLKLV